LVTTINQEAAEWDGDDWWDDEEHDDDDATIFDGEKPWSELTAAERKAKTKAFLRKLANAHVDARDGEPFLKTLDVGADPYGNVWGRNVKTRTSHSLKNEAVSFPNIFTQHDSDHRSPPTSCNVMLGESYGNFRN